MDHIVNWEPMFRLLETGDVFQAIGYARQRSLVHWPSVVQEWRQELPELVADIPVRVGQFFQRQIELLGGAAYSMVWDVSRAQELIRIHRIRESTWLAAELQPFAVPASQQESPHAQWPGPVIWTWYPPIQSGIILDGNHRVRLAPVDAKILGYELPLKVMLDALASEAHRRFYQWHWMLAHWLWAETQARPVRLGVPIPPRFRAR